MDTSATHPHWRIVLLQQRRSVAWLADRTGKSRRTVYAYSRGELTPPDAWIARASEILGVEVTA